MLKPMSPKVTVTDNLISEGIPVNDLPLRHVCFLPVLRCGRLLIAYKCFMFRVYFYVVFLNLSAYCTRVPAFSQRVLHSAITQCCCRSWPQYPQSFVSIFDKHAFHVQSYQFLPRCMECRRSLAMRILSVCLSIRLSVRLSVICVDCDKTVERSVQIYIPYERPFSLVF